MGSLEVQRRVRQGCSLTPMLFNILYSEPFTRHALDKLEDGLEIGGTQYYNLK